MGYKGKYSNLNMYILKLKRNKKVIEKYETIERKNVFTLLYNKGINDLPVSDKEKDCIKGYLKSNKQLADILMIVLSFRIMMFSKSKEKLDSWIKETKFKNYTYINKFINGIIKDYEVVVNCVLLLNQSSGVAEGKINRVKSIKKNMYGRCGFNLLRQKILLSNGITSNE